MAHVIGWSILFAGICQMPSRLQADSQENSQPATGVEQKVAHLLNQLDAPCYANRQQALNELSTLGNSALRQLALRAHDGTPESAWRIKHALESIGTQGSEDDFYKSMGILQLLDLDNSASLDSRFRELEYKWRIRQKKEIIQGLQALGAEVMQPANERVAFNGNLQQQLIANNMIIQINNGEVVPTAVRASVVRPKSARTSKREKLSRSDFIESVDTILQASVDENRDKIFGKSNEPAAEKIDDEERNDLRVQLQIARLQMRRGRDENTNAGITVRLTDRWTGGVDDLEPLNRLMGLAEIQLIDVDPGRRQLDVLASINSVFKLTIAGNRISANDLEQFRQLPQLWELEIARRQIDEGLLDVVVSFEKVEHVTLSECQLEPGALAKLEASAKFRSIDLRDMQIESWVFQELAAIPRLRNLELSLCKFETSAYNRLIEQRSNIQVAFTPQAFLGVRGHDFIQAPDIEIQRNRIHLAQLKQEIEKDGVDQEILQEMIAELERNIAEKQETAAESVSGAQITQVVSGSGADKGGMKGGDYVQKINGQPIERFEDLRLHIAQHKAGEKIDVTVFRDGKTVDLEIQLSRFDENLK